MDDHAGFRRAAREALTAEGYDVVGEAATGAEAFGAVVRLRPEIVLLDVQLPDLSGFQVAEHLVHPGRHIVLISSRPASEYRQRLASTSAAGFISKEDLTRAAIERVLGGRIG